MRSHSDGVRSDVYRIPMLIGESESLYNCKMHDLSSFSQRYHFLNRLLENICRFAKTAAGCELTGTKCANPPAIRIPQSVVLFCMVTAYMIANDQELTVTQERIDQVTFSAFSMSACQRLEWSRSPLVHFSFPHISRIPR